MIDRKISIDELFEKRGDRIPVISFERSTNRVLGLNMTNKQAFEATLETGKCHYWDDVNDCMYLKGEHSGEVETVQAIKLDSCHARRHELHLLYEVEMEEGKCKFGVCDCHFFVFDGENFVFDSDAVKDSEAVNEFQSRIEKLLTKDEDHKHQQRFMKL